MVETEKNKEQNSNYCVFVIFITLISFSFITGYHLTALNSSTPAIKVFINESYQHRYKEPPANATASLIFTLSQSCLVWGCLVGAVMVKLMLNLFSRKTCLLLVHICFILSSILMGPVAKYGYSYESLIIGRFINGVARSIGFSIVLIFVAETTCRRRLGFYQSPLCMWQFIACAVGLGLGHPKVLGSPELWMWMMLVPILSSLVYIISWYWISETPVYLLKQGKRDDALVTMQKLRSGDVGEEFAVLEEETKYEDGNTKLPLLKILRSSNLRFQFVVVCVVLSSSQFAGFQAITMYSNSVLLDAGVAEEYVTFVSMGIFLQCILAFVVGAPLQRKFGTKKVFVFSLIVITISFTLFVISDRLRLNYSELNIFVIVSMFTALFGMELGPLFSIYALPSELTVASSRPTIIFYSQCIYWIIAGVTSFVFSYSIEAWGSYSLVPFLVITAALIPFSFYAIPETHKKSAAAIQASFEKKSSQSISTIFKSGFDRNQSKATLESDCQL